MFPNFQEIYRVANITPQVIWHRTLNPVEIGGYKLKKDTLTMPQFSAYFIDGDVSGCLDLTNANLFFNLIL
jgi:hypothetical protein